MYTYVLEIYEFIFFARNSLSNVIIIIKQREYPKYGQDEVIMNKPLYEIRVGRNASNGHLAIGTGRAEIIRIPRVYINELFLGLVLQDQTEKKPLENRL